jgi:hypothetical protein
VNDKSRADKLRDKAQRLSYSLLKTTAHQKRPPAYILVESRVVGKYATLDEADDDLWERIAATLDAPLQTLTTAVFGVPSPGVSSALPTDYFVAVVVATT